MKPFSIVVVLAILLVPSAAGADAFITPFVGADFGGDAGDCANLIPCSSDQLTYGAGVGFMVGGVLGLEGEIASAPHFFGDVSERSSNSVLTAMANLMLGLPIASVRPYAVAGIGLLHTDINQSSTDVVQALSNNSVAFDVGGGLMVFVARHVGIRGDLRYVRTLSDIKFSELGLSNKKLQYGRGTIGVVLRF